MNDRSPPDQPARPRERASVTVDVGEQIRAARTSDALAAPKSHTAITLVKASDLRVVLVVLAVDAHVKKHRANGSVSIHVLDGRVRIRLAEDTVEVSAGHVVALGPAVEHDVEAVEASALLLTMGWHAPV